MCTWYRYSPYNKIEKAKELAILFPLLSSLSEDKPFANTPLF